MRASRVAVVTALLLLGVVAAEAKDLKARVKIRGGEQKRVFALFGGTTSTSNEMPFVIPVFNTNGMRVYACM